MNTQIVRNRGEKDRLAHARLSDIELYAAPM